MKLMKLKMLVVAMLALVAFISCKKTAETKQSDAEIAQSYTEEELYRPNYHFTPKANWMNDPNGMFYYNGYYHLYFQYHPESNVWGPMHWGHAISTDMIAWTEQPIAIYPGDLGTIFSGSAVVDISNSSGFGEVSNASLIVMMRAKHSKNMKITLL